MQARHDRVRHLTYAALAVLRPLMTPVVVVPTMECQLW